MSKWRLSSWKISCVFIILAHESVWHVETPTERFTNGVAGEYFGPIGVTHALVEPAELKQRFE